MMNRPPELLLASNSPRRRELLALGGWPFGIQASNLDESLLPGEAPGAYVRRLALEKARAVESHAQPGQVILGADTSVVIDGEILGKPADSDHARQMLTRLRGRTHQVFTGVAAVRAGGPALSTIVITDVPMRPYSDEEIEQYLLTGDALDKAGAYGIQNPAFQPVAHMAGCYASVMGLPLCHLDVLLREMALPGQPGLAENCQSALNYACPVWRSITAGTFLHDH